MIDGYEKNYEMLKGIFNAVYKIPKFQQSFDYDCFEQLQDVIYKEIIPIIRNETGNLADIIVSGSQLISEASNDSCLVPEIVEIWQIEAATELKKHIRYDTLQNYFNAGMFTRLNEEKKKRILLGEDV